MKRFQVGWLGLLLLTTVGLSGCKLAELTDSANVLLQSASELVRAIDTKVESGELDREVGDLLDERIEKLMEELQSTIQNSGGHLFDSANGTINLTFANISDILTQIKTGILDESIPALLEGLSAQLMLQVNMLSTQLQDIVVLTFANTFVLVDKTVNGIVIICSLILLGVGLLIFGILWFKKKDALSTASIISLVFMGLYILFFTGMSFVPGLRGWAIASFDFAQKVSEANIVPKVVGVMPETFVLGKSKRIVIYGTHLNLIKNPKIALFQGQESKLVFPKNTLVEVTPSRIIMGNFEQGLNWKIPRYEIFRSQVLGGSNNPGMESLAQTYALKLEEKLFPIKKSRSMRATMGVGRTIAIRGLLPATRISVVRRSDVDAVFREVFVTPQAMEFKRKLLDFFRNSFSLPEGDFGLRVFEGDQLIASPQFISIFNPPPPSPKPDITITGAGWDTGMTAIKNKDAILTFRLGFSHPEEISRPFPVRITVTPPDISPLTVNVNEGDIAAAQGLNYRDLKTSAFKLKNSGNYTFSFQADPFNNIQESNESNNQFTADLQVKQYSYDATLEINTFESLSSEDYYEDEYRITFDILVGNENWRFNYNKDGEPGHIYSIAQSRNFTQLAPGQSIVIATSGYEADSPDADDSMGGASKIFYIEERSEEIVVLLNTGKYKVTGKLRIRQILQ